MEDKLDVKGLIKALNYKNDWRVRRAAAVAFSKVRDARAVKPLIEACEDENQEVRQIAAASLGLTIALGRIDAIEVNAMVEEHKKDRQFLKQSLPDGDRSVLFPRGFATESFDEVLLQSKVWLDEKQYEDAIQLLILVLKGGNELARRGAVIALGMIRENRTVAAITKALEDANEQVRREAAVALDKIQRNRDVELGKKERDQIAETAAKLAVFPPSQEAIPIIKDLLLMGFDKEYLDSAYRY